MFFFSFLFFSRFGSPQELQPCRRWCHLFREGFTLKILLFSPFSRKYFLLLCLTQSPKKIGRQGHVDPILFVPPQDKHRTKHCYLRLRCHGQNFETSFFFFSFLFFSFLFFSFLQKKKKKKKKKKTHLPSLSFPPNRKEPTS